jgi:hypothetical protein
MSRQTGAGEWAGMKQETVCNCCDDEGDGDEAEVDRCKGLAAQAQDFLSSYHHFTCDAKRR